MYAAAKHAGTRSHFEVVNTVTDAASHSHELNPWPSDRVSSQLQWWSYPTSDYVRKHPLTVSHPTTMVLGNFQSAPSPFWFIHAHIFNLKITKLIPKIQSKITYCASGLKQYYSNSCTICCFSLTTNKITGLFPRLSRSVWTLFDLQFGKPKHCHETIHSKLQCSQHHTFALQQQLKRQISIP